MKKKSLELLIRHQKIEIERIGAKLQELNTRMLELKTRQRELLERSQNLQQSTPATIHELHLHQTYLRSIAQELEELDRSILRLQEEIETVQNRLKEANARKKAYEKLTQKIEKEIQKAIQKKESRLADESFARKLAVR